MTKVSLENLFVKKDTLYLKHSQQKKMSKVNDLNTSNTKHQNQFH